MTTQDQIVDPFNVQGAVTAEGKLMPIDYAKLIDQFGTRKISSEQLDRLQALTGHKPHPFLRRGLFFSHRDLDIILDRFEKGKPFYLYTGRGPSSGSMHVGHMVPFLFCKWLQDVFGAALVIQLTDDEKFLFKDMKIEDANRFAHENARDIMSFGFDPAKTFIFSNLDYMSGAFYKNVVKIAKCITTNQSKAAFGFNDSDNIGKLHFVSIQAAPSFSNTFPFIFGPKGDIPCLIPCAIDQDPYFRLTRDVASRLKYPKPSLIHSMFFPALQGPGTKMSASDPNSAIYISDTAAQIKNKIKRYAFSGGGDTQKLHQENGGNPDVDVAFQYLRFFMDDDAELDRLETGYRKGTISTMEMKEKCVQVVSELVTSIQEKKAKISNDLFKEYMDPNKPRDAKLNAPLVVANVEKMTINDGQQN